MKKVLNYEIQGLYNNKWYLIKVCNNDIEIAHKTLDKIKNNEINICNKSMYTDFRIEPVYNDQWYHNNCD